ncbi:MAG: MerR family transcriptional regulator [Firmicutes bacterium]|nr:MerR family transcriptional regulator [Bacillota bacterium]
MIKIGDFSKLSLVSIKTLRYYDELGLFKPIRVDESTGYRYYSAEQLPRLYRILALKDLGLNLDQIAALLKEEPSAEQIRGMLRLKKLEVEDRLAEERMRLRRVEALLEQIEREGRMPMYEVVLKKIPAQRVAAVRRILPNYGLIGGLFGELFGPLMGRARFAGPPLGIYHDQEFKEENVDVEVAVPVEGGVPSDAPAQIRELAGGEMACAVYQGPYERIGEAYNAVMAWLEPNGYHIAGPVREVYLRGPGDTQNPEEYVTEIQVPVEKA